MPSPLKHSRKIRCLLPALAAMVFHLLIAPALLAAEEPLQIEKDRHHLILTARKILVTQQETEALLAQPATRQTTEKLERMQAQLNKLYLEFDSMATELTLEPPEFKDKKSDWIAQLEELTLPLLQMLKDITAKPRRIENLKNSIAELEIRLKDYEKATQHLQTFLDEKPAAPEATDAELFQKRILLLKNKYDPELVRLNLEKAQENLQRELAGDQSVVDSASEAIREFFKNRGRNVLITLGTFLGLWWLLTRLRKWIAGNRVFLSMSPAFGKLFTAAYNLFALGFAMLAGLACLYFFNDWLLISLVALTLLLVVWTSRQWVPKFLKEIRLILNLGTVREDERLLWQGIPWQVREIGLQATLVNERLEGGEVRLPVHELIGKFSRPLVDGEPWFPSSTGDWVLLSDHSYGRVQNQTMEQVVLWLKGGSLKFFPTADFLSMTPVNLSTGFRYSIEFGLDYSEQSRVCTVLPALFEDGLKKKLRHHLEGDAPDFKFLAVRFASAGASSLNLAILIDADGRMANQYEDCKREVQAALVALCNENNLTIPFNQMTVTLAPPAPEAATAAKQPKTPDSA